MKRVGIQLGFLLLEVSCAVAQTLAPVNVQNLQVVTAENEVRVEVTLSAPVKPSVIVATNPDRLVVELPNTLSDGKQRRIPVHSPGIREVRLGLHQADPPITHLVIDLDRTFPYQIQAQETLITLILPLNSASAGSTPADASAPVSASQVPLGSIPGAAQPGSPSGNSGAAAGDATGNEEHTQDRTSAPDAGSPPRVSTTAPEATPAATPDAGAWLAPAATESAAEPKVPLAEPAVQPADSATATDQTLLTLQAADPTLRTVFRVKYVGDGVVYLDGGSSSGLAEGMKLEIRDTNLPVKQGTIVDPSDPRVVAELEVGGVAETSAIADIHTPKRPVKVGDLAYLSSSDAQALIQQRTLSATRKYPAVVSFTDEDAMDEEAHDEVPRPPMPSVNRARGMFGFNYMGTMSGGSTAMTGSDVGFVTRLDITRLGGTYWNVRGYWIGRINAQSASGTPTMQELINRTYHLYATYDNPNSRLVAGFGRMYLPWAPSLDTIDGGYIGARLSKGATVGMFAGSTPDPTSWSYNPDGKIAGAFVNFEGGSYDDLHYTSTSGFGINALKWQITRPFVFFENSVSYKRYFSIYDSLQVDSPRGNQAAAAPGAGLSRNFLTIRVQPHPRFEFDVNHTYFRDIPTFDPQLIGTGLLDKYLFQGFSVGARVEVVKQIWAYTEIGQSNRSGDAKNSLNQSFGITFNRITKLGLHTDLHYSRFNSSFGSGSYRALSVSRNLHESLGLQVLVGDESFNSSLTNNISSRFVNATAQTPFGAHYYLQGGYTVDRGSLNYNQWMFTLGYRFDTRKRQ